MDPWNLLESEALIDVVDASIDDIDARDEHRHRDRELIALADRLAGLTPTATTHYLQAFVHYEREPSDESVAATRASLWRVLEIEPDNARAWRYLGHSHFDTGEWAEAHRMFERSGFAALSHNQVETKLAELMLACRVRLAPDAVPNETIESLVEHFEHRASCEVEDELFYPVELVAALVETDWPATRRKYIGQLGLRLIDASRASDAFEDERKRFERWSRA